MNSPTSSERKALIAGRTTPMKKTRYVVEIATLHGSTRQRRWHLAHIGQDKAACHAYIERAIADLPTEREARRSFGLTQERARAFYRVRGVRT